MDITIRTETTVDYPFTFDLIKEAFASVDVSDKTEHFLVERLRKSQAFIPELSLVACQDNRVIGHIILTKILIKSNDTAIRSLALAPVSVLPNLQGKGIGGLLIRKAHRIAESLGYGSIVLIGHENYYPRFGYKAASEFGITFSFEVPDKNAFAIELKENALSKHSGRVEYAPEFFE